MGSLLKINADGQGFLACKIDLNKLFESPKEYKHFMDIFDQFIGSDPLNSKIIKLNKNILSYRTEYIYPEKKTNRKKVLFLLGNPATHSVFTGIPFSYEKIKNGKKREHRFWEALRKTGFIDLPYNIPTADKKKILFNVEYDSSIAFGIDLFITIPSTSSRSGKKLHPIQKKSGVLQIKSLIGNKAFKKLAKIESDRLKTIMLKYDAVIACQKDAYDAIKSEDSPDYIKKDVTSHGIETTTMNGIPLFCSPPTYLFRAGKTQKILQSFREKIERLSSKGE